MPIKILMPALSPTMTEGNLAKWLKNEGDAVKSGDVIAEIETDKATMEVEAVDEGTLGKILVPGGTEGVKVNEPIALLLEEGEDKSALEGAARRRPARPTARPRPGGRGEAAGRAGLAAERRRRPRADDRRPSPRPRRRRARSPPARWRGAWRRRPGSISAAIKGSGPHGRIVKADIEAALQGRRAPGAQPRGRSRRPRTAPRRTGCRAGARRPAAGRRLRRDPAQQHAQGDRAPPDRGQADDPALLPDARLRARRAAGACAPSSTAARVRTTSSRSTTSSSRPWPWRMRKVPGVNASWGGDKIYQYKDIDVSVAVAIEGGLITPIVRKADQKGLSTISNEMKDLAKRAKDGKLKPEEFQGGGFSISNLGMFGIKDFLAVINPPQACILAVGAGEKRPVVKGDEIKIATVMSVSLSTDHRVVDGALGAQFLQEFKKLVEDPLALLL